MANVTSELVHKEGINARLAINISAKEVDRTFKKTLQEVASQVHIRGFRPGKAPKSLLIQRLGGKEVLQEEVRRELIERYLPKALEEHELNPVDIDLDNKNLSLPEEGELLHLEVAFQVFPEVTLPDLNEIIIDSEIEQVTDEMVEEQVALIRFDNAVMIPVERAAAPTDLVLVSLERESEEDVTWPLHLDRIAPEVAEQYIGKQIGDVVYMEQTLSNEDDYDDDYDEENALSAESEGQQETSPESPESDASEARASAETAEQEQVEGETQTEQAEATEVSAEEDGDEPAEVEKLKTVIRDIKEVELPEPDDELAQTLGIPSWETVLTNIRTNLQARLDSSGLNEQLDELMDKLIIDTTFEVPNAILRYHKEIVTYDLAHKFKEETGVEMEDEELIKLMGESERIDAAILKRAQKEIVQRALVEHHQLTVTPEEMQEILRYVQKEDGQAVERKFTQQDVIHFSELYKRQKAAHITLQECLGQEPNVDVAEVAYRMLQ